MKSVDLALTDTIRNLYLYCVNSKPISAFTTRGGASRISSLDSDLLNVLGFKRSLDTFGHLNFMLTYFWLSLYTAEIS